MQILLQGNITLGYAYSLSRMRKLNKSRINVIFEILIYEIRKF